MRKERILNFYSAHFLTNKRMCHKNDKERIKSKSRPFTVFKDHFYNKRMSCFIKTILKGKLGRSLDFIRDKPSKK